MFKKKTKLHEYVKRQIAKVLAVVMALSSFTASGLALNNAYAAETNVDDHGQSFINNLLAITASGMKYEYGGVGQGSVDCQTFIRLGLKNTYGLDRLYAPAAYLMDANDETQPALDASGNKIYVDIANKWAVDVLRPYVGRRLCVEGNGVKCYYRVYFAGTCGETAGTLDIPFNGSTYSSIIAYACSIPGSIIRHNEHYGVGLGVFNSASELLAKYPQLSGLSSGTAGINKIQWLDSAYNLGNSYGSNTWNYYFGKSVMLSAASERSGIIAHNYTTSGKNANPNASSELTILLPETVPVTSEVTFIKVDAANGQTVPGAKYGIYRDRACTDLVQEFTTTTGHVKVNLNRSIYYVKETYAPQGYTKSSEVITLDLRNQNSMTVHLYDDPTDAIVIVRKIDKNDSSIILAGAEFAIYEYNYDDLNNPVLESQPMVILSYNDRMQAYTINSTYTNSAGVTVTDNTLQFSQKNRGYFLLVETKVPDGYNIDLSQGKLIDINNSSAIFTGNNSITNTANLELVVKKTDTNGNPLSGAEFKFEYNGQTVTKTTGSDGLVTFGPFVEGSANVGKLTEITPPSGYTASSEYAVGKYVTLAKDKLNTAKNAFTTTVTVKNDIIPVVPAATSGKIVINKTDLSAFMDNSINGTVYYALFVDSKCTTYAKDLNGTELSRIEAVNGKAIIDNLPLGDYYLKEIQAPTGYAVQANIGVIRLSEEFVDGKTTVLDGTTIVATPKNIGDFKQMVEISMQKVDKDSGLPVAGALYGLYAGEDLTEEMWRATVKKDQLIGYYVTDENGMIAVTYFGSDAFEYNGTTYEQELVMTDSMMAAYGSPLCNGLYYFKEIEAPDGYLLDDSPIYVNAQYVHNATADDVEFNGGSVGPFGRLLIMDAVTAYESRQTVNLILNKVDATFGNNNVNAHYGLGNYSAALQKELVASLEGAVYKLINTTDIIDVVTGDTIPAGTTLGRYETDADGKINATTIKLDGYNGNPIPNGSYEFVEVTPPKGYALNSTAVEYSAAWTGSKTAAYNGIIKVEKTTSDTILSQNLIITKLSDDGVALKNVIFEIYSVAEILESGATIPYDTDAEMVNGYYPIDRDAFAELIRNNGLTPKENDTGTTQHVTNENGVVDAGSYIYGDYIVFEVSAPQGYIASDATYIRLPWVLESVADSEFYLHELNEQPTTTLEMTVVNETIPARFFLTIEKIDENTSNLITNSEAWFELYDSDDQKITQGTLGDPWTTGNTGLFNIPESLEVGTYTLKEIKAPNKYGTLGDITLIVTEDGATATFASGIPLNVSFSNVNDVINVTVKVPNEVKTTTVLISKYENINGIKVPVIGAKLQILDETGNLVYIDNVACEWITDATGDMTSNEGLPAKLFNLPAGNYKIHEVEAPAGYATASDVEFTVQKIIDVQEFSMENKPTVVEIAKYDGETKLNGAILRLLDSNKEPVLDKNGNEITWTSSQIVHRITHIPVGVYFVEELSAPKGYYLNDNNKLTQFIVADSTTPVVVGVTNDRLFGQLQIVKLDSINNTPLEGVTFNVVAVDDVFDPLSNEIIFTTGQVIETLKTDVNGKATTSVMLPIGTYNEDGYVDAIQYKIVETVPVLGSQYDINAATREFTFDIPSPSVDGLVIKTLNLTNNRPDVKVSKTGTPLTYVGSINQKNNVTVVKDGENIYYTITVRNDGTSPAWDIVVRDVLPQNTEFVNIDAHAKRNETIEFQFDEASKMAYWRIGKLDVDESVDLTFTVKANSSKACEIVNIAEYTMPAEVPGANDQKIDPSDDTLSWKETDAVVHQIVEFHKTSVVLGGSNKENAVVVSPGDEITYILTFESVNEVFGLIVSDALPKNVTYVDGSAIINGVEDVTAQFDAENNTLTFTELTSSTGIVKFEFKVTVDEIKNNNTTLYYENTAKAFVNPTKDAVVKNELLSETIVHKADKVLVGNKTGSPETYVGSITAIDDVTVVKKGDKIVYTITVKNNGLSDIANVVVEDKIPDELVYVEHKVVEGVKSWIDNDMAQLTWYIDKLNAGDKVELEFTATVKEQKTTTIINTAEFGTVDEFDGENAPKLVDKEHTESVVHHVVEFHKTSEIFGGTNKDDATPVAVGDTILYTLQFKTEQDMTNVLITDAIPDGLTFVPGSIKVRESIGQWIEIDDDCHKDGIITLKSDMISAGTYYFQFAVTVDHIPANSEKFYINKAIVEYDLVPNNKSEEPAKGILESEEVSHITMTKLEGNKTGKTETFVGDYDDRKNVTVVEDGEDIVYLITIQNTGVSELRNVVIRDYIPEHTEFVSVEYNGTYDEDGNYVEWVVDKIAAGKIVTVQFTVKCTAGDKVVEIRNKAMYATPEDKQDVKEHEWIETDEVIYQTVKLTKDASIEHGVNKDDAKFVEIGKQFTYIIEFEAMNDVFGLVISDVIPKGLTFVPESAKYVLPDKTTVAVKNLTVDKNNKLVFPELDVVPAGKTTFCFDVTVEDVEKYDTEYHFINQATATVKENKDSDEVVDLITETVSNETIKEKPEEPKPEPEPTPEPEPEPEPTPEPEPEPMPEPVPTGDTAANRMLFWACMSLISAIAMFGFGLYGFSKKKK